MNVFNRNVKRIHRNRIAKRHDGDTFEYLRDVVAERVVDRLEDITRDFPRMLDLGTGRGQVGDTIAKHPGFAGIEHIVESDYSADLLQTGKRTINANLSRYPIVVDDEFLPFGENSFDLVTSSMSMHWINDLPNTLNQICHCLKPDGVFLGAMLGGETLKELRSSFILADEERSGGVQSRVSPLAQVSDAGSLLQSAGFALPTVDTDFIQVDYDTPFDLLEHLQNMGESNAPFLPSTTGVGKESFLSMASIYHQLYGNSDGTIPATFQIMYMIGWKPAATQPKPLQRGSAKMSIRDAINKK